METVRPLSQVVVRTKRADLCKNLGINRAGDGRKQIQAGILQLHHRTF